MLILLSVSLFLPSLSPAVDNPRTVEIADVEGITGTFVVILFGSRHSNDLETIAFLDLEGDEYTFQPYAPDFDFKVKKHLSAKDALHDAGSFVSWHPAFWRFIVSKVIDGKGSVIGYEVRPFYKPLTFGLSDVLDVFYSLRKNNEVRIHIKLKPRIERQLQGNGGRDRDK